MDALGTSETAKTLTESQLRSRLRQEDWYHRFVYHKNEARYLRALYFTDNVVVAAPADEEADRASASPLQVLTGMLVGAATYLVGMVVDAGLAYRGALTFGPAYVDTAVSDDSLADVHMAHGWGIVEAATLEHTANYPRIAISDAAQQELHRRTAGSVLGFLAATFLRDERDGIVFLDHLSQAFAMEPVLDIRGPGHEAGITVAELAATYRAFILNGLEARGRVRQKYEWLAAYYNYVAVQFGHDPIGEVEPLEFTPIQP
jgi:hypothetical protein